MDPLLDKQVSKQDQSLSSLCLLCCSNVDLNVIRFVGNDNLHNKSLIDKILGIIFLLRNLLNVPEYLLKRNFKECGNPDEWGLNLCVECTLLIRQARDLHGLILKIGKKLKDVQKIIVEKAKNSCLPSSVVKSKQLANSQGSSQKKNEVWKRTREFVKNYNYKDQFVNPFVEGDKLAKSLRTLREQQEPIPTNLNIVKREQVPLHQIEIELEGGGEEEDVVPFNSLEEDDMDMDWEVDPLENYDEEEEGDTGENNGSKGQMSSSKKKKRVQRPNIIVDGKYKCRYCKEDRLFDKRKACFYHESKHLSGKDLETRPYQKRIFVNGKWKCRHCDHMCETIKGLHVHEKEKHCAVKGQFVCDNCGKAFNSKKYLQSHNYQQHGLLASGEPVQKKNKKMDPRICSICGSTLWSQRGFQNHMQVVHGGLFKFECEVCGRKIPTSTALKKHMLCMHKEDPITMKMVEEEGLKLWKCEVVGCNGKFLMKTSLDKHTENVHQRIIEEGGREDQKRYNCEYCGKGFWERHKLRRHELIHQKVISD